jgi:hypothetical protein
MFVDRRDRRDIETNYITRSTRYCLLERHKMGYHLLKLHALIAIVGLT